MQTSANSGEAIKHSLATASIKDTKQKSIAERGKERIDKALKLARFGFKVLPLANMSKQPLIKGGGGFYGATRDPEKIKEQFSKGTICNIGIRTDTCNDRHIFVVDIDGPAAIAIFDKLETEHGKLPDTLKTITKKGTHSYYYSPEPIGSSTRKAGAEIDIKGFDGYVVAPPSVVKADDGTKHLYKFESGCKTIAEAPSWLVEIARNAASKYGNVNKPSRAGTVLDGINPAAAEARAREYLKNKEPAAEGNRNNSAYIDANVCKDYGCDINTTKTLMKELWLSDQSFESELEKTIESAYKTGKEAQGSSAPESIFSTVELDPEAPIILSPFDQMNAEFAYMIDGGNGTGCVMWETTDQNGNPIVKELSIKGFHDMHASKTIQIGSGNRYEQLSVAWIKSDKRRSYKWAVFEPNKKLSPEFYNTWRGFAVAPVKGSWSKMRAHIRDVICGGDKELDRYVMGWLARMIQYPGLRAEVALVLRGKKGTGKGLLGTMLARIVGRYAIAIANPKLLVGNFNAHLREKIFVFADEAFFAGDKQHESVLKQMITEERIVFERKGHDAEDAHNYLHVLMASNEDWVVPATADERRFCMINVSDARREDAAYFDGIIREMESGGLAAMLYDLQKYDVSKFNVRIIPQTLALADQKISGLKGAVRWLYECLAAGQFNSTLGSSFSITWEDKEQELTKNLIYEMYLSKSNSNYREYRPQPATVFWRDLREVFRCAGMDLLETRSKGKPDGSERIRQVVFPDLNKAREAFSIYMRANIEWDYDPS